MLQRVEDLIKEEKPIVMVSKERKPFKSRSKIKKRIFMNQKDPKQVQECNSKKVKKDQSEDVCHYCNKEGHENRNYF